MTPERARYILANTLMGSDYRFAFRRKCNMVDSPIYPDGITEAEHAAVLALWDTMPGSTCYADVVRRIAHGENGCPPVDYRCECGHVGHDAADAARHDKTCRGLITVVRR